MLRVMFEVEIKAKGGVACFTREAPLLPSGCFWQVGMSYGNWCEDWHCIESICVDEQGSVDLMTSYSVDTEIRDLIQWMTECGWQLKERF